MSPATGMLRAGSPSGGARCSAARWCATSTGARVEKIDGLPFESIVFQAVPEEKTAKNRIHIDVSTADLGELVAAGAMPVREKGDGGIRWTVMVDPAGNEFCAFTPDD